MIRNVNTETLKYSLKSKKTPLKDATYLNTKNISSFNQIEKRKNTSLNPEI